MTEEWVEVSVEVPHELVPIIENYLDGLGSAGTVEDTLRDNMTDGILNKTNTVKGYFMGTLESTMDCTDSIRRFASSLGDLFPKAADIQVSARGLTMDDWEAWKRFFKVTCVSERIVIKPSWENYTARSNEAVVEIDPGMAFGTGTHESTRLCLKLLDRVISGGESVLDVGTGSGILAIAAGKLGAGSVLAIDIDAESVRISGNNVDLNHVADQVKVSDALLEQVEGAFDIVFANILAEDLIEMRDCLIKRVKEKGVLILSGILCTKAEKVISSYTDAQMKLLDEIKEGEWSALLLKR